MYTDPVSTLAAGHVQSTRLGCRLHSVVSNNEPMYHPNSSMQKFGIIVFEQHQTLIKIMDSLWIKLIHDQHVFLISLGYQLFSLNCTLKSLKIILWTVLMISSLIASLDLSFSVLILFKFSKPLFCGWFCCCLDFSAYLICVCAYVMFVNSVVYLLNYY